MRFAILGSNGMLGGMLKRYLSEQGHEVLALGRRQLEVDYDDCMYNMLEDSGLKDFGADYIINCIGAIKPTFRGDITNQIYTNAVFPRELANWVDAKNGWGELDNLKLIHITTDCVFDGADGGYVEKSPHNPTDAYGKSKSLGEPENCMVIRTSIIGPEWNGNKRSLIEWLLSKRGGKASGYSNHVWNGVTTLELSKCIETIAGNDMYQNGTFHVFSEDINKFELLKLMNTTWDLGITLEEVTVPIMVNRTLRTQEGLNRALNVAGQAKMAEELRPYIEADR